MAPRGDGPITPIGAPPGNPDITDIIRVAVENKTPGEELQKLLDVFKDIKGMEAKAAFNAAMSAFKAECPPIRCQTTSGQFTRVNRAGVKVAGAYAALGDISRVIDPVLGKHGLAYRWSDAIVGGTSAGQTLTQVCVLSHAGGHSERASVTFPIESRAGASPQQKYGSTMTYARRYSLIAVLGLTTTDLDDDGAGSSEPANPISIDARDNLIDLLKETHADEARFLAFFGIETVGELPGNRYDEAVRMLGAKRRKAEKAGVPG